MTLLSIAAYMRAWCTAPSPAPTEGASWTRFHSEIVERGTSGTVAPAGAAVVRFRMRAVCDEKPPTSCHDGVISPLAPSS